MPQVSNLTINLQSGTENTLYATWGFVESSSGSTTTSKASIGDTVTIKSGSKWYNGSSIPSWVMKDQWIVQQISGNRAVINKNISGSHRIMSPIHINNLVPVKSTKTNTTSNTLDHYSVTWYYDSGNSVWFNGGSSDTDEKNATYTMPSNAVKVKCTVKPVSKTYTQNNSQVSYWTGTAVSKEYLTSGMPPSQLSVPSVVLDKYTLKASIENIEDAKCDQVEFEVYKENSKFRTGIVDVSTARAQYSCSVDAGSKYRVRCRAINLVGSTKVYGEWSNYSSEALTIPATVTNVICEVQANNSIKLSWIGSSTATSYSIEYTTNKLYFDSSSEVSSTTVTNTYVFLTGLEAGKEWYFRVRASNSQGDSGWSEIVYKIIGTKPEPPTTWSLTTSAIIGEEIILYWVHNSEDGSKQTQANIELMINEQASIITVDTENTEKDPLDRIYSYKVDLSKYPDGAEIFWRVRTRGITFEYSDWSIQRTINVYAPPTLELHIGDDSNILSAFPYNISCIAGPNTQTALTYHVSIKAEDTYETQDQIGNVIQVNAGSEVYSKVFTVLTNEFSHDLLPSEITLENNQFYNIEVTVAMNSGLTATANSHFMVSWQDSDYDPDASVTIDKDSLSAYIIPFVLDYDSVLVPNLALAVYRREFDGTFTEIASELDNDGVMTVIDPHPSLDFARYRIVARDKNTSVYSFTDLPGIPVGEPSIVIQWEEKWSSFDYKGEDETEIPPLASSMLRLKGNVDVSESYSKDAALVEYIGRKHPVSYYGTQRGSSATWSTEIAKSDKETVYALRRLANWEGDVYVREPSGNGYSANITLSMSIKHLSLTIPVSFTINRVEGDI